MICPYCNTELSYCDEYFTGRPESFYGTAANGIYYESTKKHLGNIYKCKNANGFSDTDDAIAYANENNISFDDPDEIVCDSSAFNGNFYTDTQENLKEGYPC